MVGEQRLRIKLINTSRFRSKKAAPKEIRASQVLFFVKLCGDIDSEGGDQETGMRWAAPVIHFRGI